MRPRAKAPVSLFAKSGVEALHGSDPAAVDAALATWRRKAADILLAANAAVHLPVIVLVVLGYGPPVGPLVRAICLVAYLVMAAAALLRRFDYQLRLWAYLVAAYVVVAFGNLLDAQGPYAQVGLIVNPVFVLVLFGTRAARFATLASVVILCSAPFLRLVPGVGWSLVFDPATLPGVHWFREAGVAAFLAALMVLLDRFHQFLLDALAGQRRAMHERQSLEREIAAVGDAERRRLGQELHDGVCQQVTAALLRCKALQRSLEEGGALCGADLSPLASLLGETIEDAHNIALGLCPLEPYPEALAPALRGLTRQVQEMTGVRCEFRAAGDVRVPDPGMAQHLYRIAQEAVNNAVRHAHPNRIAVELHGSDGELILQVQDDGAGLPREFPADGLGLRTMTYRARILEGELTVAPAPGGGVRVTCCVPRADAGPPDREETGDRRWIPSV